MVNAAQSDVGRAWSSGRPRRRGIWLPGVDGIRALAVSAVVVYHLDARWLPGGYLGVDVFFVISGFLITRLLLAERADTGGISLRHYWLRRARRILPPLFPMLLATAAVAAVVDRSMLHTLRSQLLGALSYTSNWVQIAEHQSYFARFGAPSALQHLWSLAVEEQFYLVWPLIVLVIGYRGRRGLAVLAVLAGCGALGSAAAMAAWYQPGADPSRVYYGTDTHAAGLLIGALLGIAWSSAGAPRASRVSAGLSAIGIGGVGVGFWLLDEHGAAGYRGGILAVSLATAVLIVGAGNGESAIGRLLSSPAVRWIGTRSYGLYLWHWPVFVLGDKVFGHRTPIVAGLEVAVAVLLAASSYRWVERPVLRYGYRGAIELGWRSIGATAVRRGGLVVGGGAVAATGVFASVALLHAPPPPWSELERQLAAAGRPVSPPPIAPPPSRPRLATPARPIPAGDQIAALGDSVMLGSAPALRERLPGIWVDAMVNRGMWAAPDILDGWQRSGVLRPVVLLGLGTNGEFSPDLLEGVVEKLADHTVYLVNAYLPRPSGEVINRTLQAVADAHPNVHLVDWQRAASGHEDLLYPDRIHARPGAGADLYARTVVAAMSTPKPPPVPAPSPVAASRHPLESRAAAEPDPVAGPPTAPHAGWLAGASLVLLATILAKTGAVTTGPAVGGRRAHAGTVTAFWSWHRWCRETNRRRIGHPVRAPPPVTPGVVPSADPS